MKRSWRKQAPKLVSARRKLEGKCGKKCFLLPGKLAFPICPKSSCKPSCQGLRAAYSRARQTHRSHVASAALKHACRLGCTWTERHGRCAR